MRRLLVPVVVAVAAVVYFVQQRGYPLSAAVMVGLSLGVLGYGFHRTVEQLRAAVRAHRAPLDLRRAWHGDSVVAQERPREEAEGGDQQQVGRSAGDPADEQQEEPRRNGGGGQPQA